MKQPTKINCPKCNAVLDVEEVLGDRIEKKYQQQYNAKVAELAQQESALQDQLAALDKQVAEKTREALARKEKEITQQTEDRIKSQYEVQLKSLSEDAAESKKQLQHLKTAQIENERLKRQIESQKQDYELEYEKRLALNDEANRKKLETLLQNKEKSLAELETGYKQKEAALKTQIAEVEKQVAEKTREALAQQEKEIAQQTEERIKSQYEVQLKSLTEDAVESKKQLQHLKTAQIENERLKRQIESQKQDIELEYEKKLSLKLKEETETISKKESERHESVILELKKQLEDQRSLAEEMKRKAEQGSQQLQGEVQELMIEEFLRETFPTDMIAEIGKGKSGADVKHVICNRFGAGIGIMLYESKNTKDFNSAWIEKLKSDAEREDADIAVLVTKTMPKNMDYLGFVDGIWICSVPELKGLVTALRESLIQLGEVRTAQTNKGEKMQMLYDYLTDGKFVEQIKRVVSGFAALREGYQKEKEAMQKIWKKRDVQLEMMLRNTSDFVTQIQTIAGASLPQLEAPEEELLALGSET